MGAGEIGAGHDEERDSAAADLGAHAHGLAITGGTDDEEDTFGVGAKLGDDVRRKMHIDVSGQLVVDKNKIFRGTAGADPDEQYPDSILKA